VNQPQRAALDAFIQRMPKAELHLHLEGTVAPATYLELARRNHVELPVSTVPALEQLFEYDNFAEFLGVFMTLARALRTGEDFDQVAYELGAQLAADNVRYAEVMISPGQYHRRGLNLDEIIEGTLAGFARATADYGVRFALALDCGRQFGPELASAFLAHAVRYRQRGMVAWSIGGDEHAYPSESFREVFASARAAGLRVMCHAGEVVGPPSVWGAIDALQVERVGHGIHSVADPLLVAALCDRGVTLDICPTSNLRTGACSEIAAHPLRTLFDAGVRVTVNTDDPVFFGTTMCGEYRLAAHEFGFSAADLTTLALNAVDASFLPAAEQQQMRTTFASEIADLRDELGL
jgi:adenosine deaminase